MQTTIPVQFKLISCCKCGMIYAVPEVHVVAVYARQSIIYCPSGHPTLLGADAPTMNERRKLIATAHRAEQVQVRAAYRVA